ncbi:acyl carrier protein [Paenibacillus sp. SYP-B4298]|uniref:acyl carrier protein n=1 Tax=Paenibacillus sp. SYP-B4298 TaxID=2996034 RepID=UPI0022DE5385|nr:phosphopantetheine-binding protein [Paenibacillus sp. SYP-B4298]
MDRYEIVKNFIQQNLIIFEEDVEIQADDNIFALGFVNSLFAMQLLQFIEREFAITVDNEDLEIANFSTLNKIISLIDKKTQSRVQP